jgi:uncharacterized protein (DUF488 family)
MGLTVYTIGHSTHPIERFLGLLAKHRMNAIADVRSWPYSRRHPQFDRESLRESLREQGLMYVFLGDHLGARPKDRGCYEDGKVRYEVLAASPLFRRGLERVLRGAAQFRLALMCVERDPLDCHRAILVARQLAEGGARVHHILGDGALETQEEAVERLLRRLRLPTSDLFRDREENLREAYNRQSAAIAYEDLYGPGGPAARSAEMGGDRRK